MTDLHHIQARHDEINRRLEEWAKWVRVKSRPWGCQPMFRMYQSKARQWDATPHIPVTINSLDALEIERGVAFLPDRHRAIIRLFYVFPWVHIGVMQRAAGVPMADLPKMLDDSRDMLKNRLKQKLVDLS